MNKIFGEFIEDFDSSYQSLELSFDNVDISIKRQWRNHRLSAYFLADYLENLLPINNDHSDINDRLEECKNTVSFIGNELLENAIKFKSLNCSYPVKFGIHFFNNLEENLKEIYIIVFTKNSIDEQNLEKFQEFIQKLLSFDTNDLYIKQIEKTAEADDIDASGLGLLSIINDYSAKVSWKFDQKSHNPPITVVTTMAQIVIKL